MTNLNATHIKYDVGSSLAVVLIAGMIFGTILIVAAVESLAPPVECAEEAP
jgi:hypothetical protein